MELAAVATSPPLVHRSLEAEGAPTGAGGAGGQQLAAMSIEAENYAQAGGRMTQAEWQALNTYRWGPGAGPGGGWVGLWAVGSMVGGFMMSEWVVGWMGGGWVGG